MFKSKVTEFLACMLVGFVAVLVIDNPKPLIEQLAIGLMPSAIAIVWSKVRL